MPYRYRKVGNQYCVYKKKKDGSYGEKVGCTDGTKKALKKYLAALHANESVNNFLEYIFENRYIRKFIKK